METHQTEVINKLSTPDEVKKPLQSEATIGGLFSLNILSLNFRVRKVFLSSATAVSLAPRAVSSHLEILQCLR